MKDILNVVLMTLSGVIKRPLRSFFCFKGGKNERENHSIFRRKKRM